jgi:restriction system protein
MANAKEPKSSNIVDALSKWLSGEIDPNHPIATLPDKLQAIKEYRNRVVHGQELAAPLTAFSLLAFYILSEMQTKTERPHPELVIKSVIIPERMVSEGVLIKSTSVVWASIVDELRKDWTKAYEIPPRVWEELVAGAYKKAGFDDVILTPRSGDHGRDVIAYRKGVGSVKIIGSVKAYKPGHLVSYDDVRALLGVMSGERNTSKGIITTTSDFPPNILKDPFIEPFLPYRLELLNGAKLQEWLKSLAEKKSSA